MSISITINDPANTPRAELARAIAFLEFYLPREGAVDLPFAPLDPADNPSTGQGGDITDAAAAFTPSVSFAGVDQSAAQAAFGGNEQAAAAAFGAPAAGSPVTSTPHIASSGPAAPSVPPAAAAPAGAQVDKRGLPWDPRIHAKGKDGPVLNADGTWRAKRGVDEALVAQVEAQLRATMGAPLPPVAAPVPQVVGAGLMVPPAPPPPAPHPVAQQLAAAAGNVTPPPLPPAIAPSAPAATPTAPAGAPAGANEPQDFVSLVTALTPLLAAKTVTTEQVNAVCKGLGVEDMTQAMFRPDLAPNIWRGVQALPGAAG